jgi:Molybdopterin-binding domain of aldehyde dehydrogenase
VRDPLAEIVLKMPKEKLRLITPNVGGGFGMKAFVYPEHALVVQAARRIARPVKWQEDRSEGFVSDNQGRDHMTRAELALDEQGRFLGLRVSVLANIGAYLSPFGSFVPTRSTDLVSGLYAIGAIHINVKGVCTNTVPVCAYRGRRPPGGRLSDRGPGRRRGARDRQKLGRHPAHQFRAAVRDALHVGDQAHARFRRVREGDGSLHGRGRMVVVRQAGRRAKRPASCAASAWRPIPSAAAAAFPRPPRSSSRTTTTSSW